jgi:CHASE2 domain-containing sensor protein
VKNQSRSWLARWFGPYPGPRRPGPESREGFHGKKFWEHYKEALLWIFLLIGAGFAMQKAGLLIGFETAGLDTLLRLGGWRMSERVVIIEVTDPDYENDDLFAGKSPLKQDLLLDLVSTVQNYHPAVIAMDFSTESAEWCKLNSAQLERTLPGGLDPDKKPATPVVWAEVPHDLAEPVELTRVLGGRLQDFDYVGLPRFPVDSDGMLRHYEKSFRVRGALPGCEGKSATAAVVDRANEKKEQSSVEKPQLRSLAGATIARSCKALNEKCPEELKKREEPVILRFHGDRYNFPIIQAHEFIGRDAQERANSDDRLRKTREALFANKIVLIGGTFSAARDVYPTPLGPMAGVELIGLAIESEFSGGIHETQEVLELLADFLVGSLIVLIYFYYERKPRFALVVSLVGVPLLAIFSSAAIFRTTAYWFNFVPVIIGMVMHQMLELSESTAKLQKTLFEVESRIPDVRRSAAVEELPDAEVHEARENSTPTQSGAVPGEERRDKERGDDPT